MNTDKLQIVIISFLWLVLFLAGVIGLFYKMEYSGWILFVSLCCFPSGFKTKDKVAE